MTTKEDGVFRKAYRDDAIIAICRPEKLKKNTGKPPKPRLGPTTDSPSNELYGRNITKLMS